MVWFQCEDCGENLKKPKLANHFRMCSAYKLSCIDCGQVFSQESVQSHTQCISEAEKYGPKDQGKSSNNAQTKPKPNSEVDVNVGLSSRAPWFCSLCNTSATSKQTLMLHADGKKHRAKARAFHAAQKQSNQEEDPTSNGKGSASDIPEAKSVEVNGSVKTEKPEERDPPKETVALITDAEKGSPKKSKRKHDASSGGLTTETKKITGDSNGEVVQAEQTEGPEHQSKKKKCSEAKGHADKHGHSKEVSRHKIKWKKLVTSTLKSDPDGAMKIKKLHKLIIKALQESGVTGDESELQNIMMDKISSSSRFIIDNKRVRIASKIG